MLELCKKLFRTLNQKGIEYCSWKGNDHLEEGLNGKKDLDILVKKERYFEINEVLFSLKFKKYEPKSYLKYMSIEDFIGLDELSGNLIHIHLHYEIRIGRKFIEEYHLPFEEYIYSNRIHIKKYDIFLIDPNLELILFIMRYILQNGKIHGDFSKKLDWYTSKICTQKLFLHAETMMSNSFADLLIKFITGNNHKKDINMLRKETHNQVKHYKTSTIISSLTNTKRKFEAAHNYFLFKICNQPVPYRRVNPYGGKVLVFIGVDGSGKSTLVSEINKWLSWKVDVFSIYFGSGDGKSSIIRYPLLQLVRLVKLSSNIPKVIKSPSETKRKTAHKSWLYSIVRTIWAILLAYEKRNKFTQLWRAKSKGLIVLCDRFPQYQVIDINDGPLLSKWLTSQNFIKRKFAHWELGIYQLADRYPPDIVIKLKISDKTALERKPEMTLSHIKKKIEVIDKIKFNENTVVYEINTKGDLNTTLTRIKTIIWKI